METLKINLDKGKKLYFASDFHLGDAYFNDTRQRENKIISWLNEIRSSAGALLLVGDIFDFWFDYKQVVPRGYVRLMAAITKFTDNGIPVYYFKGNHDMWLDDYFSKELGCVIVDDLINIQCAGKNMLVGHGDGYGPGDPKYKLLKKVFRARISNFLFRWIHPDIGMWVANKWSTGSKKVNYDKDSDFRGEEEWLYQYCCDIELETHYDYYVFGHRHLKLDMPVGDKGSRYINIGEWMEVCSYGEFDGERFALKTYE